MNEPATMFEFWPFDMASGPSFLAFYAALVVASAFASLRLGRALAERIDRGPGDADPTGEGGGAYRQAALPSRRKRLTLGSIPGGDEVFAITYLRRGTTGLAESLLCAATAAEWLVPSPDLSTVGLREAAPDEPLLLELYTSLASEKKPFLPREDVRRAADSVAAAAEGELRADLRAAGLHRSDRASLREASVVGGVGVFVLVVGLIRAGRGASLRHPIGFLSAEILLALVGFLGLAIFAWNDNATARGRRYLRWLRSSTRSLCGEVAAGRRTGLHEILLAVAAVGAAELMSAPIFYPLQNFIVPPSSGGGGDSGSSSSCGGGSCGGGGCGGGGCGG
jgi:uncharacterized protein (TIGR04222 family)